MKEVMMENLIIVRGGGDIASGTISKLYHSGFSVLILECEKPSAIRRNVAFSEAVYEGSWQVEDVTCHCAANLQEAKQLLEQGKLTLLVDPQGDCIAQLEPLAVVDAILAKKNLGTHRGMAPITIGLGPGFEAGKDVDAVIETMRGHDLGRIIYQGKAMENTGVPGIVGGYAAERVLRSPIHGRMKAMKQLTETVKQGEIIAYIEHDDVSVPVTATIDGLLRGLLRDGYEVTEGFKIGDIDPRIDEYKNCFTISDKARCIAGAVLEAILHLKQKGKTND